MKRARALRELYKDDRVLAVPIYSVGDAARYLRVPENTVRSWVAGRISPGRRGTARTEPVIRVPSGPDCRLSFLNLVEVHVLDALRRQYRLKLPDIRTAVRYLRHQFKTEFPLARKDMLTDGRYLFVEAVNKLGGRDLVNASREGQLAMRGLAGASSAPHRVGRLGPRDSVVSVRGTSPCHR